MRLFNRHTFKTSLTMMFLMFTIAYYCHYSYLQVHPRRSPQSTVRIMYVVRTVSKYYSTRLIYLLQTWIPLVHDDVFFVSDILLPNVTRTHIIPTETACGPSSHSVRSLCCQTTHDFILYRRHAFHYDWFCHFDDDQYVHVNNLYEYLSTLDPDRPYYIGRNSWNSTFKRTKHPYPSHFWFATFGAGVCLSKRTLDLLESHTRTTSQFMNGCIREFYPDDIYLGFLISNHLNLSLTKNLRFHSHLERSLFSQNHKHSFMKTFHQQITFGFWLPEAVPRFLPHLFPINIDPLRMRTLHCLLYAQLEDCQIRIRKHLFNMTE
ncbi:unnamed protein product [Rotaria socialis]|uniref:Fringe-like glycosyltransferase domain-containing protein n=2 Tax=Rotaria socialis TaxID=392032 RepID=A0A820NWS9_9BILA|nr:unnamed protein product [Rotaria socialis]CAF3526043.1 unnamed protein product [Rotaria socialis]CAF4346732.1 unnamed protein product [Rotaria socialis]CAF4395006.1 unnamed protein product [Rotaria socialis]CAF4872958.1 unnamed protein product [Rotaria socialis]